MATRQVLRSSRTAEEEEESGKWVIAVYVMGVWFGDVQMWPCKTVHVLYKLEYGTEQAKVYG